MNATLAGLLQACAETTYESTSHLILADWMDDHGQPERAELIRVQCRLADWVPDWRERLALIARQDEIIAQNRSAWLGALPSFCERIEFVRGLCRIEIAGSRFASTTFGQAFTAAGAALIEQVRLLRTSSLARITTRPWLAQVPSLSLDGLRLRGAGCEPHQNSPSLENLVARDLSNMGLPLPELLSILRLPLCQRLSRLTLRNAGLPLGLAKLLPRTASRLQEFDLAGNCSTLKDIRLLEPRLPPTHRMNSLGMEFVRIPAGEFRMGAAPDESEALADEQPQHTVTLTQPFWLGRFVVTRDQYRYVISGTAPTDASLNFPVRDVSAWDAEAFCKALSEQPEEIVAGRSYRLPTEAEWEHACRAGTFTTFSFGDRPTAALVNCQPGYLEREWTSTYRGSLAPIGTYPANGFGLHEMHGSVWEWCADWYDAREYGRGDVVDPVGPDQGTSRMTRGGCYGAAGANCRSARRGTAYPTTRNYVLGFRVVMVQAEEATA